MQHPKRNRALGIAIAGLTAVAVALVGLQFAGGDPVRPPQRLVIPAHSPRVAPVDPTFVDSGGSQTVTVEGKEVVLPRDLLVSKLFGTEGGGLRTRVAYVPVAGEPAVSWVEIGSDGYISTFSVREGDQSLFAPLLEGASRLPTPTPLPVVAVGGLNVQLEPGMIYERVIWSSPPSGPNEMAWVVAFAMDGAISRVYLDDDGRLLKADVQPQHAHLFDSLIAAARQ